MKFLSLFSKEFSNFMGQLDLKLIISQQIYFSFAKFLNSITVKTTPKITKAVQKSPVINIRDTSIIMSSLKLP